MYQYPGLVDAIINVIRYDEGGGRSNGCGILWYLARCRDIDRDMYQHNGLVNVLLNVANEDLGDARVHALRGIVNIAWCAGNMREMFLKPGLIDALLKVVKDDTVDARSRSAALNTIDKIADYDAELRRMWLLECKKSHTYRGVGNERLPCGVKSVIIAEGVTAIRREKDFNSRESLVSLQSPHGLTTVRENAFASCSSLVSLPAFSEGLTEICDGAFNRCQSIISTSLSPPSSTHEVASNAFNGCSYLNACRPPDTTVIEFLESRQINDPFLWLVCAKYKVTKSEIKFYLNEHKDVVSKSEAISNLSPIHVLCLNPTSTLDVIKYWLTLHPETIKSRDMWGNTPLAMAYKVNLPIRIQTYLYSRYPLKEERYYEIAKDLEESIKLRVAVLTCLKTINAAIILATKREIAKRKALDGGRTSDGKIKNDVVNTCERKLIPYKRGEFRGDLAEVMITDEALWREMIMWF